MHRLRKKRKLRNSNVSRKREAELFERQKEAEAKKFERKRLQRRSVRKRKQICSLKNRKPKVSAWSAKPKQKLPRQRCCGGRKRWKKRAQAYQKYNNAAMAEMLVKVPDIAGQDRRASDPDRQDHDHRQFGRIKRRGSGSRKRTGSDDKAV